MSLISLVIVLIVVGVLLWLVTLIPMDPKIRMIIQVVVVIAVVLWLLTAFGLLDHARSIRVG